MKIDGHPFPTNMVNVKDQDAKAEAKILTFEWPKRSGAVDPEHKYRPTNSEGRADTSKEKA